MGALKKNTTRRTGKNEPKYRLIFISVALFFLCFYPYITRITLHKISDIETGYFINTDGYIADLFLYCKEIALLVFIIITLAYFLGERIFPDRVEKIKSSEYSYLKIPLILITVYTVFVVLSSLLSEHPDIAWFGGCSEYEGAVALITYMLLVLFGYFYFRKQDYLKLFHNLSIILILTIGLLAVVEYLWKPILNFSLIQSIISSDETYDIAKGLTNENFTGQVALTFNNPGYLGGFCSLFVPIGFNYALNSDKFQKKLVYLLVTAVLIFTAKVSNSNAALFSLIISAILFSIIYRGRIKQFLTSLLILMLMSVILIFSTELIYNLKTSQSESSISSEHDTQQRSNNSPDINKGIFRLDKMTLEHGVITAVSGNDTLIIKVNPAKLTEAVTQEEFFNSLIFNDGVTELTEYTPAIINETAIMSEKQGLSLVDERYSMITFCVEDSFLIIDFGYAGTVEFIILENGFKAIGQNNVLLDEIRQPDVTGLEWMHSFATGRGYIWAQSLPILKECLPIGKGAGHFPLYFGQNEIVGLLNTHGSYKYVVDKPHNWYLQIAISSGIPALLCILALFIYYLIGASRSIIGFGKNSLTTDKANAGIYVGLLAFMIVGVINDSCITVNPLFWFILGIGLGQNSIHEGSR